jgi:hypothetical protein
MSPGIIPTSGWCRRFNQMPPFIPYFSITELKKTFEFLRQPPIQEAGGFVCTYLSGWLLKSYGTQVRPRFCEPGFSMKMISVGVSWRPVL